MPSRRRWHLVPIGVIAGPLRNLSSPSPRLCRPCSAGLSSRRVIPEIRRTRHTVPDLPLSPICVGLCWSLSFRRHVLAVLQQSTALRYPVVLVGRFCQANVPARCSPRLPPNPQMRQRRSESGGPFRTFSPTMLERSARTFGTVATMFLPDSDILRASADDRLNPPAPVDRLACARRWGSSINRLVGHPSSKKNDSGRDDTWLWCHQPLLSLLDHTTVIWYTMRFFKYNRQRTGLLVRALVTYVAASLFVLYCCVFVHIASLATQHITTSRVVKTQPQQVLSWVPDRTAYHVQYM